MPDHNDLVSPSRKAALAVEERPFRAALLDTWYGLKAPEGLDPTLQLSTAS
jgi:hypothetical protein